MNQNLHDTGKSGKSKRKPKRRRNREPWKLIYLMIALHLAQAGGGWALYLESKADMNAGFERLEERIVRSEAGLRADMSSMEDGLRAEIAGLRAGVSGLTERVARVETRLHSIEGRLDVIEGRLNIIEGRLYVDTARPPM